MKKIRNFGSVLILIAFQLTFISSTWCRENETLAFSHDAHQDTAIKGFLFEVVSPLGKRAHIFGSVEYIKKDSYPLSRKIETAFFDADTLMLATDFTNKEELRKYAHKVMYKSPDKSENHLKPELWIEFSEKFDARSIGNQLIPAYIAIEYLNKLANIILGYDTESNLSLHFIQSAKATQKKVVEFEGLDFKANFINSISDEENNDLMEHFLKENVNMYYEQRLASAWENADSVGIEKTLEKLRKKTLLSKRLHKEDIERNNEFIASKLVQLMDEENKVFALIDIRHLFGEKNVLAFLSERKFEIHRLQ